MRRKSKPISKMHNDAEKCRRPIKERTGGRDIPASIYGHIPIENTWHAAIIIPIMVGTIRRMVIIFSRLDSSPFPSWQGVDNDAKSYTASRNGLTVNYVCVSNCCWLCCG